MSAIALNCLQIPTSPIKYAMTAIIVTALIVSVSKMDVFYDQKTGMLKNLGTSPDETILPAWLAMTIMGHVAYVMSSLISAFDDRGH
jgi:hypothetical protein